jgi:hypothetical protein
MIGDSRRVRRRSDGLGAVGGTFHFGDVDFNHLHHGLHGAASAVRVGVSDQLHQAGRRDLPEDAPAILKPAAGDLRAAIRGERRPEPVRFGLIRAGDEERDRLGEGEARRVQRDVRAAGERELDEEHRAGRATGRVYRRVGDAVDPRVRQEGDVEPGRLLGLPVE